jgi:hypothetical protein
MCTTIVSQASGRKKEHFGLPMFSSCVESQQSFVQSSKTQTKAKQCSLDERTRLSFEWSPVPIDLNVAGSFACSMQQPRPELWLRLGYDEHDAPCAYGYLALCLINLRVQVQLRAVILFQSKGSSQAHLHAICNVIALNR